MIQGPIWFPSSKKTTIIYHKITIFIVSRKGAIQRIQLWKHRVFIVKQFAKGVDSCYIPADPVPSPLYLLLHLHSLWGVPGEYQYLKLVSLLCCWKLKFLVQSFSAVLFTLGLLAYPAGWGSDKVASTNMKLDNKIVSP